MRVVAKIAAGFFFVIFFLVFLLLATLRFEVLNPGFVFWSFERNGVYQKLPVEFAKALPNDPNLPKEEREEFAKIAAEIHPQTVKRVMEKNLVGIFDFLNGKSRDINIVISASELGLPGTEDINWSLSKNAPHGSAEVLSLAYGIGNKFLIALFALFILLALLFRVIGRRILLICGILALIVGGIGKVFLLVIIANTPAREPAQVLLLLLSSSVLADIAISWLFAGAVLIFVWFLLKKTKKAQENTRIDETV